MLYWLNSIQDWNDSFLYFLITNNIGINLCIMLFNVKGETTDQY